MTKTNGAPTLIFGKPVPSFMVDPGRKVGQSESGPGCARHPHSYTFCNMYWYMWWLDGLHPGQTKPCANVGVKSFHAETWVWRISLARILDQVCEHIFAGIVCPLVESGARRLWNYKSRQHKFWGAMPDGQSPSTFVTPPWRRHRKPKLVASMPRETKK